MRIKEIILALFVSGAAVYAQGTVNFYNRGLTDLATGATYDAPLMGHTVGATAQLFLVTGSGGSESYTPLFPTQSFRDPPNQSFFREPVIVTVPGMAAGTVGTRVVVRYWQGPSWLEAFCRGEGNVITLGALGGIPPNGAPPIVPPNLDGMQSVAIVGDCVPEPSALALAMLGALFLVRRRNPQ
jgi:hypothetical protein